MSDPTASDITAGPEPNVLEPNVLHPTRWWTTLDDGRVQCDVCPRHCKLHAGQRGACFVRARAGNAVVLTTYGRSSGFCIDPIEKKPLAHFLPGSAVFSFGTAGCNLSCKYCQNWDITKSRDIDVLADDASPEAIARAAVDHGCRSVAFTYNDPIVFLEYAVDVAAACHEVGLRTVAVSSGYICDGPRDELYGVMDAANIDLKGFTEDFYRHLCGGHLAPVLDTLEWLVAHGVWTEVTTLVIPGHNDDDAQIGRMSDWLVDHLGPDVPLHLTAFHPDYKMLDVPGTRPETLTRLRHVALDHGLHHVYTGNVHDPAGGVTRCVACGTVVAQRDGYRIDTYRITDDGRCGHCGANIPGVFDGPAGTWGPRRQPVRMHPRSKGATC